MGGGGDKTINYHARNFPRRSKLSQFPRHRAARHNSTPPTIYARVRAHLPLKYDCATQCNGPASPGIVFHFFYFLFSALFNASRAPDNFQVPSRGKRKLHLWLSIRFCVFFFYSSRRVFQVPVKYIFIALWPSNRTVQLTKQRRAHCDQTYIYVRKKALLRSTFFTIVFLFYFLTENKCSYFSLQRRFQDFLEYTVKRKRTIFYCLH